MDWNVADDKPRSYNFSYDNLSRLTIAGYFENGIHNDKFSTSYNYDKHGNMLSLMRNGNLGTTSYGLIDKLSLSYYGNQLIKVEDAAPNPDLSMSMVFRNGAMQDVEYSYDENGNMVKDLNKGISKIEYNLLNLPQRVTFTGANNPLNEYVYSAGGKKLAVIHKASSEKRTDYVGNMIYENGILKCILVDGGFIENGAYHFFLQDHLGNNRVVAKADGTVVQTNHYYPYGMSFAESTQTSKQPYKYNGKELDAENGLNLYDFDARQMESALGRFTTIDPQAEKKPWLSGYVYCSNNPLNKIDPTGEDDYLVNSNGFISLYKKTDDNTDRLILANRKKDITFDKEGNYTNKNITLNDKKLLSSLAKAPEKGFNGHYGITPNKEDAFNLFKFTADNTQVEWAINGYHTKVGDQFLIRTSNKSGSVSNTDGNLNITDMFLNIHSHWSKNDRTIASGYDDDLIAAGDWAVINKTYNIFKDASKSYPSQYPYFYIYHAYNKRIYKFTPNNPSIPKNKISTYKDFYK